MKKRYLLLFAFLLGGIISCADAPEPLSPEIAAFGVKATPPLRVMSQNLYLGADLDPLLDPTVPIDQALALALQQLGYTNYVARAGALAAEIAARQPDVVGLQEVTTYQIGLTGGGTQVIDFLGILTAYLGGAYDVAIHQTNAVLMFPVGFGGIDYVNYSDGEAILVRHGLAWSDAAAAHYQAQATVAIGGFLFENLRGWTAVSVDVDGQPIRFMNTHLEIQLFRDVQEAQAAELAGLVRAASLPVVLVGDFNSAANHDAPARSKTGSYDLLRRSGLTDLWLREPHSVGGLTCCQAPDLSNPTSLLDQRLDIVFARATPGGFGGASDVEVVGDMASDRFNAGGYDLWPSDHAGVFAELWFAPGLKN